MAPDARSLANVAETLVLFGGVPYGYLDEWAITSELSAAEGKVGVRFAVVERDELLDRLDGLSDAEQDEALALAGLLAEEAVAVERGDRPDDAAILRATRLYVAMRLLAAERRADAVSIVCDAFRREAHDPVPCVALTLFQDDGVPAACQGDIDALLTMVLLKRVSGLPSFMGGAWEHGGRLALSHCVLSRRMHGPDAAPRPYYLADYHGRRPGPTLHTDLPPGTALTIARLTRNLESLLLTTGTLADAPDIPGQCRNTLLIDVPDLAGLLARVSGGQYHLVVACGDHAAALTGLCEAAGIEVIGL